MSVQAVSPVAAGRRIGEVDTLRGFALFGILVTNTVVLTMLISFQGTGTDLTAGFDGGWDRFGYAVIEGLFLGKFYLLFAFLFGYSFTLQIAAAERAGARAVPRLLRRSGALFLIGLAHVMFLWLGDILTLYAGLCVLLILFRKVRARTALITGIVLYALFMALAFLPSSGGGDMSGLGNVLDVAAIRNGFTGGFADTFRTQLTTAPVFMIFTWIGQGVPAFGMFLIGMAAGKRRVFEDAELLRRWTPRALLLGFGVGLPVALVTIVLWTMNGKVPTYWYGLQELCNPLLTLGYVAGTVWLTRSRWAERVRLLAPAGRMAASNYLLQSIVFMLLYTGYGLALGDRVPPLGVMAIAVVIFAGQVWLSDRWLRRYAYGPVEWVLRAATYRSVPAWRKSSA
ncbi:DUF418 domain-containing protein [Nocardia yamanashiensis]|uniref:DUF418 domain-containing protein n=1 Tax=Nocardia yamanashiensis TaxID=209247 RepID=UPI001E5A7DE1|nr:DUF418 domain-containing protein [Nocardia yamanashiensis]UGT43727.1 DUF418 domain-containing protein [Nocardia yamanashiensis]